MLIALQSYFQTMKKVLTKNSSLAVCAIIAYTVLVSLYWPGFFSTDSFHCYIQALGKYMDNHFPPIIPILNQVIMQIMPISIFYLLVQCFLLTLGVFLLVASSGFNRWSKNLMLLTILLLPWSANFFAHITVDPLMCSLLIFAFGLMSFYRSTLESTATEGRKWWLVSLILLTLFLAIAVRHNGILASGIGIWCLFYLLQKGQKKSQPSILKSCIVAALVTLLFYAGAVTAPHAVRKIHDFDKLGLIAVHDIAGTVKEKGYLTRDEAKLLEEVWVTPHQFTYERLTKHHKSQTALAYYINSDLDIKKRTHPNIAHLWRDLVLEHPIAYLTHRAKVFYKLHFDPVFLPFLQHATVRPNFFYNKPEFDHDQNRFQAIYAEMMARTKYMFSPGIYFFFNIIALITIVSARKSEHTVLTFMVVSGLVYQMGNFFVASESHLRYSAWLMLCGVTAFTYVSFVQVTRWLNFANSRPEISKESLT